MRLFRGRYLMVFALLTYFPAMAAHAAATPSPAEPQTGCAAVQLNGKDAKFTGQISSGPNGSLMEVSSGNETVLVHYTPSVAVCLGGQPASMSSLAVGSTVVVYGIEKRKGKVPEIDAVQIVVAGNLLGGIRSEPVMGMNDQQMARGDSMGQGSKNNPQTAGIPCEALTFAIKPVDEHTGRPGSRVTLNDLTCVAIMNSSTMQLAQDAATGRHLPSVTLTSKSQTEVVLLNAEVSNYQLSYENGAQVIRVTFSFQRGEFTYLATGTKFAF